MKTFVDNTCRQVGEGHLFGDLFDVFAPTVINGLSDDDLVRIAAEPEATQSMREEKKSLAEALRTSLQELRH